MRVDQSLFRSALLDPAAETPQGLLDGQGRAAGRRFDVYRNNVAVSLTEALETAFPIIAKLVGATNFKTLAATFIRSHPPSSPLMMHYGAEMPDFLTTFEPTRTIGYLPDVARLEIVLRESYHAADSDAADPSRLQAMPPDRLLASTLALAPSVRHIASRWPVFSIWRFNTVDDAPKPEMRAEDVAVLRIEFDPKPFLLPSGGGAFLAAVEKGATFGEALDAATGKCAEFDLPALLSILIATGAITTIGEPS